MFRKSTKNQEPIFVTIDINATIQYGDKNQPYGEYLKLSPVEKAQKLKVKIEAIYDQLKTLHPASTFVMCIRENAISPAFKEWKDLVSPITETEKDEVLEIFKTLTKNKNLILVPGSISFNKNNKLYNRAYILANDTVVDYQGKQTLTASELKASGSSSGGDTANKVIPVSVNNHTYNFLISLCLDYGEEKTKPKKSKNVDVFLLLSNTIFLWDHEFLPVGKYNIYCDSTRPTRFIKSNDEKSVIYSVSGISAEPDIYCFPAEHLQTLSKLSSRLFNPGYSNFPPAAPITFSEYYKEEYLLKPSKLEDKKAHSLDTSSQTLPMTSSEDEKIIAKLNQYIQDCKLYKNTTGKDYKTSLGRFFGYAVSEKEKTAMKIIQFLQNKPTHFTLKDINALMQPGSELNRIISEKAKIIAEMHPAVVLKEFRMRF